MKVLVISDTHKNITQAIRILDQIKSKGLTDIIHCGDYIDDAHRLQRLYPGIKVHAVYGNCDGMALREDCTKVIDIGGVPIFITHGHRYNVKWEDYEELAIDAIAYGAKVAICGHSHSAYLDKRPEIILMNPGSISQPRDYSYPSYGILDIDKGSIQAISIMQILENGHVCTHPTGCHYR